MLNLNSIMLSENNKNYYNAFLFQDNLKSIIQNTKILKYKTKIYLQTSSKK
jgi:hypothetical protein